MYTVILLVSCFNVNYKNFRDMIGYQNRKIFAVLLAILFVAGCKQEAPDQPTEKILVRIDDKTISVNEFIRRAEYTIRPKYCSQDNYIHRKIVLNSLIAEKLYALEAGNDNELTRNEEFKLYLQGRKEQAMRQWLYHEEATEKVALDSAEVQTAFKMAGREYDISYFTLNTEAEAKAVEAAFFLKGAEFDEVFREIAGNSDVPRKNISWENPEEMEVHSSLFDPQVYKGQVIGPLKIDQDSYLFTRVNGWKENMAISDYQIRRRNQVAKEVLTDRKAIALYFDYVSELMAGKEVKFNPEIFKKLVNIKGPQYFKTEQEKEEQFHRRFWNKESEEMISDDPQVQLQEILDQPLLEIDGKTWTVGDLEIAMIRHPLVFRKRKFRSSEFGEQFKLAVVDLIRDEYITEQAYQRGYDKVNIVQRNYQMWRDNLLSLYHKNEKINKIKNENQDETKILENYLNPYFEELKSRYGERIEINTDEFEKIQLSNINMFVIQKNMAFPVVVPSFPQLTSKHLLDYGRKIN